jgi:hypothetical protein
MNNKKSRVKKQSIKKNKSSDNENINSEINNLSEIIQNNMNLSDDYIRVPDKPIKQKLIDFDEDFIRPPDSIFKERLIDYNDMDDELMMAINLSKRDYYNSIKSNYSNIEYEEMNIDDINFENINIEHINNEHMNNENMNIEHMNIEHTNNEHMNIEHIDQDNEELLKAVEISKNEQIKYEEYILNESIELEKTKRMNSLQLFCKKIEKLIFTKEDLLIKKYIESVLEDYFSLKIDYIIVDEDMYNKLYSVIDTYYLIPTIKKYKKTAITEIEDNLIRNIFRKQ